MESHPLIHPSSSAAPTLAPAPRRSPPTLAAAGEGLSGSGAATEDPVLSRVLPGAVGRGVSSIPPHPCPPPPSSLPSLYGPYSASGLGVGEQLQPRYDAPTTRFYLGACIGCS